MLDDIDVDIDVDAGGEANLDDPDDLDSLNGFGGQGSRARPSLVYSPRKLSLTRRSSNLSMGFNVPTSPAPLSPLGGLASPTGSPYRGFEAARSPLTSSPPSGRGALQGGGSHATLYGFGGLESPMSEAGYGFPLSPSPINEQRGARRMSLARRASVVEV